jgi:hypothetical protein
MQRHRRGGAARQDETGALAFSRTDRPEDVGRLRPLILRRRRAGAALRPAAGDGILLADPRLILEPDLYRLAASLVLCDRRQMGGETFLKASMAPAAWV